MAVSQVEPCRIAQSQHLPSDLMWIMTGDGVPPRPPAFSTAILHRDAVTSGGEVGAVGGVGWMYYLYYTQPSQPPHNQEFHSTCSFVSRTQGAALELSCHHATPQV